MAWHDESEEQPGQITLAALADTAPHLTRPAHRSRQVILTSGTTGTPKGASRQVQGIEPAAAFLSGIPLKSRETTVIAAPLFHAWGLAHLGLVPAEHSSGAKIRRRGITKAGNPRARRLLVESAWTYAKSPRVSQEIQRRQEGVELEIVKIAWKAQLRLHDL